MSDEKTLAERLRERGISRRGFMKFCAATASMMALPPMMIPKIAAALEQAKRPSVIWLSFQECTGCTESLTRSHAPTIEGLIFDHISLDYHHTLQAAAGDAAEHAREAAMKDNWGKYLLVVDGSIPLKDDGVYSTIAGITNLAMLREVAEGAAAIVSVGTCAAFGGLPKADPNPTGAAAVSEIISGKPIVNVPGCPPIPTVITGVLAHFLTFGKLPELDNLNRPKVFYGESIHDRCYRRAFYERGQFAESFDDEGAREGWCLFKLGCKGPVTYNACATTRWNEGTSFPIASGHGCIGCSEPGFWDKGGFYDALSKGTHDSAEGIALAAGVGAAIGVAAAMGARVRQARADNKEDA
ncbi:MAG: hydrogenase small subunit [Gammaproteobacteria bacterium]|nr:hydrogenase small subunit [Gammaproteobacteria bacterium]